LIEDLKDEILQLEEYIEAILYKSSNRKSGKLTTREKETLEKLENVLGEIKDVKNDLENTKDTLDNLIESLED
jgi:K+/H+ antiporter YhaU regulatory subunit KhtT